MKANFTILALLLSIPIIAQQPEVNQQITEDSFEFGFGNWNDGGTDCDIVSEHASSGAFSVRLKDNKQQGSSLFSNNIDLSGEEEITFGFSFYTQGFAEDENFFFEISVDGGNSFEIYQEWIAFQDFKNEERETEIIEVSYPFSEKTVFRIRNNGSSNQDQLFIDQIKIDRGYKQSFVTQANKVIELIPVRSKSNIEPIKIFPNPANDYFSINLKAVSGLQGIIEIFNLSGSKLSRTIFKKDHPDVLEFPCDYLEDGYYSICVRTKEEKLHVLRLMVSRT